MTLLEAIAQLRSLQEQYGYDNRGAGPGLHDNYGSLQFIPGKRQQ